MAPYISSHPRDSVWLAPRAMVPIGTSSKTLWLIPVRSSQPQHRGRPSLAGLLVVDHAQLRRRPAPVPRGSVLRVDSGWTPIWGTAILAELVASCHIA